MNAATIERLQCSYSRFAPHRHELVELFYSRLFAENPTLRERFPVSLADQKRRLLASIEQVAGELHDADRMADTLQQIGGRHPALIDLFDQLDIVRDTLIYCIEELSGGHWNDQLADDWSEALDFIGAALSEGARRTARIRRAA